MPAASQQPVCSNTPVAPHPPRPPVTDVKPNQFYYRIIKNTICGTVVVVNKRKKK